jgi:hypothetical protein
MILEYEKKQSVYAENACEHIVNGVIRLDDLIRTDYIPTNFSAEPKNFLLRDGHADWDKKHLDFEMKIHEEWLQELGYDTEINYVDFTTRKIINKDKLKQEYILNNFNEEKEAIESESI